MGQKWTEEQRKKFKATMAAKRKAKEQFEQDGVPLKGGKLLAAANHHDAIVYLRHAEREIMLQMRTGKKLDTQQLYTLLALNALQGKS